MTTLMSKAEDKNRPTLISKFPGLLLKKFIFQQNKMWVLIKVLILQAFPDFAVNVLKLKIMNEDCVKFFADIIRKDT